MKVPRTLDSNVLGTSSGVTHPYEVGDTLTDGVRYLAESIFGKDQIKSAQLALDVQSPFRNSPIKVTEANRLRRRVISFGSHLRSRTATDSSRNATTPLNTATTDPVDRLPPQWSAWSHSSNTVGRPSQPALYEYSMDTTKRTREKDSPVGEFEKFHVTDISSPGRAWQVMSSDLTQITTTPWKPMNMSATMNLRTRSWNGPSGIVSQAVLDSMSSAERSRASNLVGASYLSMLRRSLPLSRKFGLFRSLVELRDLPSTLKSLFDFKLNEWSAASSADRFLTYKFGIKPIIDDCLRLVKTPEKVAQKVNYLLERRGYPTTFRSKFETLEAIENPQGFTYEALLDETPLSTTTLGNRKITMRCMVNANVKFPKVSTPLLREELYLRLIGATPRPVDFYNLMPWTWLFDWFAGLSDYLDVVDLINSDDSIINYGFVTYLSEGNIRTTYRGAYSSLKRVTIDGTVTLDEPVTRYITHTSTIRYKFQLRKSLGNAENVKFSWDPESFSGSQKSILGALLLQFWGSRV